MYSQFSSVHNFNEAAIFRAITRDAALYPELSGQPELLADVACVALNRMSPRYIRNDVDNTLASTSSCLCWLRKH